MTRLSERATVWPARAVWAVTAVLVVANAVLIVVALPDLQPSGATRAEVHLAQANGDLIFEVVDDGDGFDPASTGYGTGLHGMVDRLDAIGGAVRVESRPGEGTAVRGRIPARVADD